MFVGCCGTSFLILMPFYVLPHSIVAYITFSLGQFELVLSMAISEVTTSVPKCHVNGYVRGGGEGAQMESGGF
jgi:hypothetical protein